MVAFGAAVRSGGGAARVAEGTPRGAWECSDPELVVAASDGCATSMAALYVRLSDRVRRTARRILRDEHAAEDAVQDTFVAALQHLPRLRDPVAFETWILRIARNVAISHARQRARCAPSAAVHHDECDLGAVGGAVVTRWGSREVPPLEIAALRCAYAALPTQIRETMELSYGSGMSSEAVARRLGISRICVRTRLCRGRQALREALR